MRLVVLAGPPAPVPPWHARPLWEGFPLGHAVQGLTGLILWVNGKLLLPLASLVVAEAIYANAHQGK
jgi:hypothetical protein